MDDGSPIRYLLFIVICLCGSAFFSATETALASVSKMRVTALAEDGDKRARRLLRLLNDFDRTLTALLILNDICNIAIATLTTLLATHLWGVDSVAAVTVATTVVVFLLGESLPKNTALVFAETFSLRISGLMTLLTKVLSPLIFVFNGVSRFIISPFKTEKEPTVTEDELESIIDTVVEEGTLDEDTGELVQSAMDLSKTSAADIMTPWDKCLTVSTTMDDTDILSTIKNSGHSRLPVVDGHGRAIGFLQIRKYIRAHLAASAQRPVRLRSVTDSARFVRADEAIDDLLPRLSAARTHIALVLGRDGAVCGIITVEDILEELVGEIYDEDDTVTEGGAVNG